MTPTRDNSRSPTLVHQMRIWSSDEQEDMWELAECLQGRPLPGVRLSEAEFTAEYGDEDIKAEWVDGEVIVAAPPTTNIRN